MLEKVAKLLAKAEAASTEEEAQAYFDKAQSIATAHSISLEKAREHTVAGQRREEFGVRRIPVGERGKHVNRHLVNLFVAIARSNDVEVDVAHNSTYVIAYGYPSDVDVVEKIWSSLAVTMVRLGDAWIKSRKWEGEKVWTSRRVPNPEYGKFSWGWYEPKTILEEGWFPVTAQSARASWYEGFIGRIRLRLADSRKRTVEEVSAEDTDNSTALVLKAKEVAVKEHYRQASNAKGSWRGAQRNGAYSRTSRDAGDQAGQSVSLGGQAGIGGGRKAVGR